MLTILISTILRHSRGRKFCLLLIKFKTLGSKFFIQHLLHFHGLYFQIICSSLSLPHHGFSVGRRMLKWFVHFGTIVVAYTTFHTFFSCIINQWWGGGRCRRFIIHILLRVINLCRAQNIFKVHFSFIYVRSGLKGETITRPLLGSTSNMASYGLCRIPEWYAIFFKNCINENSSIHFVVPCSCIHTISIFLDILISVLYQSFCLTMACLAVNYFSIFSLCTEFCHNKITQFTSVIWAEYAWSATY